jgi:prepilin-type N-terminal cleavage/methylation domain-containing protein
VRTDRSGVTLVELLVVLAVAGLVLSAAGAATRSAVDASTRVSAELRETEDERLRSDLLRELLWAHVGPSSSNPMLGDAHALRFDSRCPVAGVGSWPCSVALRASDAGMLTLSWDGAAPITWRVSASKSQLLYLDLVNGELRWLVAWDLVTRVPLAVGVASTRDTSVYWVGAR